MSDDDSEAFVPAVVRDLYPGKHGLLCVAGETRDLRDVVYGTITVPMGEGWHFTTATLENDRDVCQGVLVDGFMLDAFEEFDREMQTLIARFRVEGSPNGRAIWRHG